MHAYFACGAAISTDLDRPIKPESTLSAGTVVSVSSGVMDEMEISRAVVQQGLHLHLPIRRFH